MQTAGEVQSLLDAHATEGGTTLLASGASPVPDQQPPTPDAERLLDRVGAPTGSARLEILRRGKSLPIEPLNAPQDRSKDDFIMGLQPFAQAAHRRDGPQAHHLVTDR